MSREGRPESVAEKRDRLKRAAERILPEWKVSTCGNYAGYGPVLNGRPLVEVRAGRGGVFFGHVVRCQSVWVCPACGANSCSHRRLGVAEALRVHQEPGGAAFMVTLTLGHRRDEALKPVMGNLQFAVAQMKQGRLWQENKKRTGLVAGLTAREPTWGERNGWHPHTHNIYAYEQGVTVGDLMNSLDFVVDAWGRQVRNLGRAFSGEAQYVSDVKQAGEGADYVTKYGAAWELTHAHTKQAADGSWLPWEMLNEFDLTGEARWAARFREFAEAFRGQRQLTGFGAWRGVASIKPQFDEAPIVAYVDGDAFADLCKSGLRQKARDAMREGGMQAFLSVVSNAGVALAGVHPPTIQSRVGKRVRRDKTKKGEV